MDQGSCVTLRTGLRAGYLLVKDGEAEPTPVHFRSESPRRVDAATSRDISLGTWRRVTRLNLDLHPKDPRPPSHRRPTEHPSTSIRPKIPFPLAGTLCRGSRLSRGRSPSPLSSHQPTHAPGTAAVALSHPDDHVGSEPLSRRILRPGNPAPHCHRGYKNGCLPPRRHHVGPRGPPASSSL